MNAVIEQLTIKGIALRKNTRVEIDIWQNGKPMEVTVFSIKMQNGEVTIESVTNLGSFITHTAEQWEDMLVRKI